MSENDTGGTIADMEREIESLQQRIAALEKMVWKYGFASVLSGETGYHYVRCKECDGDTEKPNRTNMNKDQVQHAEGCELEASLVERKP